MLNYVFLGQAVQRGISSCSIRQSWVTRYSEALFNAVLIDIVGHAV